MHWLKAARTQVKVALCSLHCKQYPSFICPLVGSDRWLALDMALDQATSRGVGVLVATTDGPYPNCALLVCQTLRFFTTGKQA